MLSESFGCDGVEHGQVTLRHCVSQSTSSLPSAPLLLTSSIQSLSVAGRKRRRATAHLPVSFVPDKYASSMKSNCAGNIFCLRPAGTARVALVTVEDGNHTAVFVDWMVSDLRGWLTEFRDNTVCIQRWTGTTRLAKTLSLSDSCASQTSRWVATFLCVIVRVSVSSF